MSDIFQWFSDRRKGAGIVAVFVILAVFMVAAAHLGTKTLSAVRAYVAAEGKWTKAQKQASNLLIRSALYEDTTSYYRFQEVVQLHKGLQQARKTLISEDPNLDLAREGFRAANIHPQDIEDIIWLTVNFGEYEPIENALEIWKQGDARISEMDTLAREIHRLIQKGDLAQSTKQEYISKIIRLDQTLTRLETRFSATIGEAARWVRSFIFWSIISSGLLLILIGYLLTRSYFQEVSSLNEQLTKSENKFKTVLQNSRDIVYQIDIETGEYDYISPSVEEVLGYTLEDVQEEGRDFIINHIHPEDEEHLGKDIREMSKAQLEEFFTEETEFRIRKKGGGYIWLDNQRRLIRDENGEPAAIVGSVRDVTTRKRHELQIEKSLKEKQTLLQEIHHRVKNNLAVVSGILELQKHEPKQASLQDILQDTQSRIKSIAMIHEKLYKTETLSEINIREYIEEFVKVVYDTHQNEQSEITVKTDIDSFTIDITKAVPLGLIFNELLSNAFKHGFTADEKGEIKIALKKENDKVTLSVADNGRALPDDFDLGESHSLGMTLVKTLTDQLEGELSIRQNGWTHFELTFPMNGSWDG